MEIILLQNDWILYQNFLYNEHLNEVNSNFETNGIHI